METLSNFPIPNDDEIILCQINGRVESAKVDSANISIFTTSTANHPKIRITRDSLNPTRLGDEGQDLFLPTDVPFLKQLTQIYSDHGLLEVFRTARAHHHPLISGAALFLIKAYHQCRRIERIWTQKLEYHGPSLINELNQTRNWANSPIRCMAWHWHISYLAVGTTDDAVRVYSNDHSFVPILRCRQQKNITCLAWRNMSFTELAVGHETGIIVWNVDFNSLVSRPSANNSVMLYRIDHRPVISLAWSPRGNLLISAAVCDTNILIWDVELDRTSTLKGSISHGNTLLKWSSQKDKLLSLSDGITFKIWDCQHWRSDRWIVPSGRVQTACWSNGGKNLLFTTTDEPIIYGLTIKTMQVFTNNNNESLDRALPLCDLTKIDLEGYSIGGIVQSLECDPEGVHLAVSYKETNNITMFHVSESPSLRLLPLFFISGLPTEVPNLMEFQKNFTEGACLTIGWSSGRIQHFPFIYKL